MADRRADYVASDDEKFGPADNPLYVTVRALDLYRIVRSFYGSDARHTRDEMASADRLHIRLLGLPGLCDVLLEER